VKLESLCVYCGSSSGLGDGYVQAAESMGRLLAAQGITLVYGGGNVGLMGVVADAVLRAGGKVIGVIPEYLMSKEVGHTGLTELHRVGSMHERKLKMAELSDAFVALPGGIGTIEEIFEVFTWTQLGIHSKPCAFLDVERYYSRMFQFLDHMADQRFIRKEHIASLIRASDAEELVTKLRECEPVVLDKWRNYKPGDLI